MIKPASASRLSREAWADAALNAIAHGGLEAVAVEPIAERLGVTKGSFYWHFKNRSELVEAALQRWELRATARIIEEVSSSSDPFERLRHLLLLVIGHDEGNRGENAIFGAVSDPVVAAAVKRVNAARKGFLQQTFLDLGFSKARATTRARIAYSLYLGHVTLQMTDPQKVRASQAYCDELMVVLTADCPTL